jgi:hypothetical protein
MSFQDRPPEPGAYVRNAGSRELCRVPDNIGTLAADHPPYLL